jgi:hypothetical protein
MNYINKLAKNGKWQEVLVLFCKENDLVPKFIDKKGIKRIEINELDGSFFHSLEGIAKESSFNDISQATLNAILEQGVL